MRKKISLRVLGFLVFVAVAAALVNPYSRQWLFGPTHQGVPLCAWQDQIRRQTLGEDENRWLTKLRKWLEPKEAGALAEKLTREDRIAIWLSLLDDPAPALRARSIQALWGSRSRFSCGFAYDLDVLTVYNIRTYRSAKIQFYDASQSLLLGGMKIDLSDSWSTVAFPSHVSPAPPAAPHLIRMLDDASAEVRQAAVAALRGLGNDAAPAFPRLFELLDDDDPVRRAQALRTLNTTHAKTRSWLDRLMAALDDPSADVRSAAANCLAEWSDRRMAAAAGPPLVKRLCDPDPAVRLDAAGALSALRLHLDAATAALHASVRHPDAEVRRRAIGALFDAAGAALYPELLHCAQFDPDHNVRCAAVANLAYGGERAVPFLVAFLKDSKADLREAAVGALSRLGPKARLAVPFLLADLESLGRHAVQALANIGDAGAAPKLIELLEHHDLRSHALSALRSLGPAASLAAPRLLEMLNESSDLNPQVALLEIAGEREDVLLTLERRALADLATGRTDWALPIIQQGFQPQTLTPALIQALTKKLDDPARIACVQMLGSTGAQARAAVPALVRLGKDCTSEVRAAIVRALGEIAGEDQQAIPFLIEQLEQDRHVDATLPALARFGPRAQSARPYLQVLLKSYKSDERTAAIWALAAIESTADAIGQLAPMIYDRDENVRAAAAAALCSLGPPDEAVRSVQPILRDDEESVRSAVARALGELGPSALAATPVLCDLLADDCQSICDAALEALAKIEP